jgi:hypothetical protein
MAHRAVQPDFIEQCNEDIRADRHVHIGTHGRLSSATREREMQVGEGHDSSAL